MPTLVVYASVDRTLGSSDANHATAVAGAAAYADDADEAYLTLGDSFFSPTYYINEAFLEFDASALPDDCTIDDAVLALYGRSDSSSTDFTIEAAAYDFGASIGKPDGSSGAIVDSDWLDGTDTAALTVVATRSTSGWSIAGYNDFSNAGGGVKSVVSKTGVTRLALWPERVRTGSAPANGQHVEVWSADEDQPGERRPRLTIEYTEASPPSDAQELLGWGAF